MQMPSAENSVQAGVAASGGRLNQGILSWIFPAASFLLALLLGLQGAILAPDANNYRLLALGQHGAVPNPFAVRVLGPAIAGWLGRAIGIGPDRGFLVLGVACLAALLVCLAYLLRRWQVSAGLFAAIFLMPFWVALFHDYYLPDLLHAALLGVILLCLARGQNLLAMALIFPAFLARESTLLVAVCLALAAWRRIPLRAFGAGVVATLAGFFVSEHFAKLGAANTQGLGGGLYMLGKLLWNFPRNLLGVPLWTNTLSICAPVWSIAVPHGWHLGGIRFVGLCPPSLYGPTRLLLAWAGIFGIGPAIALLYWRNLVGRKAMAGDAGGRGAGFSVVFRFSVIYGLISLLIAPLLGASTDRLVEYAWPFFLVALPSVIAANPQLLRRRAGWLLPAHLVICWLAWHAFRVRTSNSFHAVISSGLAALAVNVAVYLVLRRDRRQTAVAVAAAG